MNKSAKKWLIAATSLIVIGAIMFTAVMTAYHWDFSRLGTDKTETNTYEISEGFDNIKLNTETADIRFSASTDGRCKVVCYEHKNLKHSVNVNDGTLTVNTVDNRKWYDHIGIDLHSPEITICLPETEYGSLGITGTTGGIEIPKGFKFGSADISLSTGDVDLSADVSGSVKIKTTTGDIRVADISAGALDLSVSTGEIIVSDVTCTDDLKTSVTTGDVYLKDSTCQNLISNGSTSDISLKKVIAAGKFSIERSTGDVVFENSDAAEIFVKTSTGNVTGSLLSEKVFIAESSTGSISVPKTTTGGKCDITTSTGDIILEISNHGR